MHSISETSGCRLSTSYFIRPTSYNYGHMTILESKWNRLQTGCSNETSQFVLDVRADICLPYREHSYIMKVVSNAVSMKHILSH